MSENEFAELRAMFATLQKTAEAQRAEIENLRAEVSAIRERVVYQDEWIIGWDKIAEHLGYSMSYVQWLNASGYGADDPIPVEHVGRYVRIKKFVLDAWKLRWTKRVALSRSLAHAGPRQGKSRDGAAS